MRTKRGCHRAAFFISISSLIHKIPITKAAIKAQNPPRPKQLSKYKIPITQAAIKAQKAPSLKLLSRREKSSLLVSLSSCYYLLCSMYFISRLLSYYERFCRLIRIFRRIKQLCSALIQNAASMPLKSEVYSTLGRIEC